MLKRDSYRSMFKSYRSVLYIISVILMLKSYLEHKNYKGINSKFSYSVTLSSIGIYRKGVTGLREDAAVNIMKNILNILTYVAYILI